MQELNQTLNKIKSKQKLGLPLTDRERALWTLYSDDKPAIEAADTDAAATVRAELCATLIAPILDIIVPIIDAITLRIKQTSVEQTRAELNDYARKGEFVAKYLSPMLAAADMNVESATYRCHIDTHEEYVDIVYKGGHKRRVCVTADSLQALIFDVMR